MIGRRMDDTSSALEDLVPGSDRLYFIFGGIAAGMGMPPFEFYNSSRILEHNKIFFRDFSQSWYQNGLPNIGGDVFEVSEYIAAKIKSLKPRHVCFVGNSMGGYAAILFALLAGTGTSIAFAPQTFISPAQKLWHRDVRWPRQTLKAYRTSCMLNHIWDLKPLLTKSSNSTTINIHVSTQDRLDLAHARRLKGQNGVVIHEYDVGGHALVKHLRDQGGLTSILHGDTQPQVNNIPAAA
jgi:hypothetical protein